jgi:hypothetical protein
MGLGRTDLNSESGSIPDYAYKPHGGLTGTILYFKRLGVA